MARRKRKTSAARIVAGLPVIQRQEDVLEPVYEADPDGRRSCTIASSTRLVGCCAPGTSLARCTMPRETSRRRSRSPALIKSFACRSIVCLVRAVLRILPMRRSMHDVVSVGRSMPSVALGAQAAAASGMSSGCSGRSANGRCARAGAASRSARSKRTASWSRRWGRWRVTTATAQGHSQAQDPERRE